MDRLNLKGRPHLHLAAGAQIQKEKQTNKTSKFKRVFWFCWSMWSWLKQNGTHNNPDRGTRKLPWQIFRFKSSDNDRCANEGVWSWYKEGIKAGIESQLWQARVPVSKWSIHCWNVGVLICPIAVKVFCCTANHVLKKRLKMHNFASFKTLNEFALSSTKRGFHCIYAILQRWSVFMTT